MREKRNLLFSKQCKYSKYKMEADKRVFSLKQRLSGSRSGFYLG